MFIVMFNCMCVYSTFFYFQERLGIGRHILQSPKANKWMQSLKRSLKTVRSKSTCVKYFEQKQYHRFVYFELVLNQEQFPKMRVKCLFYQSYLIFKYCNQRLKRYFQSTVCVETSIPDRAAV